MLCDDFAVQLSMFFFDPDGNEVRGLKLGFYPIVTSQYSRPTAQPLYTVFPIIFSS
jgi:hypothetical protein